MSRIAQFDGHACEAIEGDVEPCRPPFCSENAVVLAAVKDKVWAGAVAPSGDRAAARAGAVVSSAGARERAEPENLENKRYSARGGAVANFPLPVPTRCREGGKRNWKVRGVSP
jgi:hypothetical protein